MCVFDPAPRRAPRPGLLRGGGGGGGGVGSGNLAGGNRKMGRPYPGRVGGKKMRVGGYRGKESAAKARGGKNGFTSICYMYNLVL